MSALFESGRELQVPSGSFIPTLVTGEQSSRAEVALAEVGFDGEQIILSADQILAALERAKGATAICFRPQDILAIANQIEAPREGPFPFYHGRAVFDADRDSVDLDGTPLELPAQARRLVGFLAMTPEKVYKQDELLIRVWGYPPGNMGKPSRTVDRHAVIVNRAFGVGPGNEEDRVIKSVRGSGYYVVA